MDLLSISIMTIPERLERAQSLANSLAVPATIMNDVNHQGTWFNAKRSWSAFSRNAKYHLVLQDDVILAPNFNFHLEQICKLIPPSYVLSFWQGNEILLSGRKSLRNDIHWISLNYTLHGPCLMMPTHFIPRFIQWDEANLKQDIPKARNDDTRLGLWQYAHSIPTLCTLPELVLHDWRVKAYASTQLEEERLDLFLNDTKLIDWTLNLNILSTIKTSPSKHWIGMIPPTTSNPFLSKLLASYPPSLVANYRSWMATKDVKEFEGHFK